MRKATLMNQIRKAKQAGDKEGEVRLRSQLAQYQAGRKTRRGIGSTYRVKYGDNYFSIAKDVYGDARYAAKLARANKGLFKLTNGMILQLPPRDEEDPLIMQDELDDLFAAVDGDTPKPPQLEPEAWQERPLMSGKDKMDGGTAAPETPAAAETTTYYYHVPRIRGVDEMDGYNDGREMPEEEKAPEKTAGNLLFTSNEVVEDVASFIKNTRIRKAGLHLKSDKPEDVQAWVDNYPDEARMLAQEMVDAMVERGILQRGQQQAVNGNMSAVPRYGDQVQMASLDCAGWFGKPIHSGDWRRRCANANTGG